ncbi:carboxypeptidase-like regulatory domain-containing protein [Flaviaesturariibacter amylovorans]
MIGIRSAFLFLLLLACVGAGAQPLLRGRVVDAAGGAPVAGASVFLSNTSTGTVTNSAGAFELAFPAGRYDLVVSSVGYETQSQTLQSAALPPELTISLKARPRELETVLVQSYEKDGWAKWGALFTDHFIGTSDEARACRFRNASTVRFIFDKGANELRAIAREPLVIENPALGYRVRYQLEDFRFNFTTKLLTFYGYPLFEELKGNGARQRRWRAARRDVYAGSLMHFLRSVFVNRIQEQGFQVFRLRKFPNLQKQYTRNLVKKGALQWGPDGLRIAYGLPKDSLDYYRRYLGQGDEISVVGTQQLPGDSIAYAGEGNVAVLDFADYLLVNYPKLPPPRAYRAQNPDGAGFRMSQLLLPYGRPVQVEGNGAYYAPTDLLSLGYWGWAEKVGNMLPLDYRK